MNKKIICILIIGIVIILAKIIFVNRKSLTKFKSTELLSEEKMFEYISDLWVEFDEDDIEKYTNQQLVVISIMAYDGEVNNGGLAQFFSNSSRIFAPTISENLEQINAKKHKAHFDKFINQNKIDINYLDSFMSGDIDEYIEQSEQYPFDEFDREFYKLEQTENLYHLMIDYAKSNYDEIFIDIKK